MNAYRKSVIVSQPNYYNPPGSPIAGDASHELQRQSIDALITASARKGLSVIYLQIPS